MAPSAPGFQSGDLQEMIFYLSLIAFYYKTLTNLVTLLFHKMTSLPASYLGKWLLFVAALAFGNSISNYLRPTTLSYRLYASDPKKSKRLDAR
jgi:hypothetical protein